MTLDADDRFEIKARAFQRMTGQMAPGKDCSPAMPQDYDTRLRAWDDFHRDYGEVLTAMLEAFEWHLAKNLP